MAKRNADNTPFDPIFDRPATPRPTHPAALPDDDLREQCDWTRSRGGGPGGQHRNKVETTVEIMHKSTGVHAKAGERRSVRENMRVAISRLRLALAVEHRVGVPAGECRSDLWRSRTRSGKISLSTRHRDFPSMLAEAMDVLDACDWDPKLAATRLCVTPTQIVKLLREHPAALAKTNAERERRGGRPLK
ncbi:MAG: peptide chain release factor-like protein [Phycisphaerae bacterium]|nr:peptide chain release factor-like protein [Phycisphaerae bacterium]